MIKFLNNNFSIIPNKYYSNLFKLFCLIFLSVLFEILGVGSIFFVVAILSGQVKTQIGDYIVYTANSYNFNEVNFILVLFILCFAIKTLFYVVFYFYQFKTTSDMNTNLASNMFLRYLNTEYSFYLKRNSSSLMRNINDLINQYIGKVIIPSLYVILDVFILLGLLILLLFIDYKSVIILATIYFFFSFIYYSNIKNKLKSFSEKLIFLRKKIIETSQNSFQGIKSIKIFSKEKKFIEFYQKYTNEYFDTARKQSFLVVLPRQFLELITILSFTILIYIFLDHYDDINEAIAYLALYATAAIRILPSVNRLLANIQIVRTGTPVLNTLAEEIHNIPKIVHHDEETTELKFEKEIEFKNISFSYDNSRLILDDININIKKNSQIGIIGKTGSGKSTVLDLILGLLNPNKGSINVDGISISSSIKNWQKIIGYVPQNVFILDENLKNNITLSFNEKFDETSYMNCKKLSQVDEFLPSRRDQEFLGEQGSRLSGGQRQRIGIARALYRNPQIIIFDEATSALDLNTENQIIEDINKLKGYKTIIIVSHKINILQNCDYIYEIKDKKIIKIK